MRRIALVAVIAMSLFAATAAAQSAPAPSIPFCSGLLQQPFGPNASGLTGLGIVSIAALIMLVMAAIIGLLYAIGYAFGISNLVRFSKAEIGEIILTLVVVAVFAGFILGTNGLANIGFSGSNNIFQADCTYMARSSVDVIGALFSYFYPTNAALSGITNIYWVAEPWMQGVSFKPFTGYSYDMAVIKVLNEFTSALAVMLVGITVFLGIVYALFPLFLYLGVVLRTIPVTRPAGGGFLGFFIGFYLIFPTILFFMLSLPPAIGTPPQNTAVASIQTATQGFTNLNKAVSEMEAGIEAALGGPLTASSLIGDFMSYAIDPVFYSLFAIVTAVVVSFDMSELVADVLGAESLSSRNMLRKII